MSSASPTTCASFASCFENERTEQRTEKVEQLPGRKVLNFLLELGLLALLVIAFGGAI